MALCSFDDLRQHAVLVDGVLQKQTAYTEEFKALRKRQRASSMTMSGVRDDAVQVRGSLLAFPTGDAFVGDAASTINAFQTPALLL